MQAGPGTVVASFYPLAFAAKEIAPGDPVENLTPPGAEPHDLELSPIDAAAVRQARLVLLLGQGFQPQLEDAAGDGDNVLHLLDTPGLDLLPNGDPHVWLDPQNMVRIAHAVETQLSTIDARHRANYRSSFDALRRQLEALDRDFRSGLRHCSLDTVVVSHDAYGYLPTPFTFEGIDALSPDSEPSPARLTQLHDLIQSQHLTTVFTEPLGSPAMADTLASSAGVQTAVLDPIEGLSDRTSDQNYLTLMRQDLAALRKANSCQ